jgi:hypothetical protein
VLALTYEASLDRQVKELLEPDVIESVVTEAVARAAMARD